MQASCFTDRSDKVVVSLEGSILQGTLILACLEFRGSSKLGTSKTPSERLLLSLHPWRFSWNLKIAQLKRKVIFLTLIFGFHVDFSGCSSWPFWNSRAPTKFWDYTTRIITVWNSLLTIGCFFASWKHGCSCRWCFPVGWLVGWLVGWRVPFPTSPTPMNAGSEKCEKPGRFIGAYDCVKCSEGMKCPALSQLVACQGWADECAKRFLGVLPSLKLTFSPLKMDGWKTSFLLGWPIFRGELLVFGSANSKKFRITSKLGSPFFFDQSSCKALTQKNIIGIHRCFCLVKLPTQTTKSLAPPTKRLDWKETMMLQLVEWRFAWYDQKTGRPKPGKFKVDFR